LSWYFNMFSGWIDLTVGWAFVVIWIGIGTIVLHLRDLGRVEKVGFPVVNVRGVSDIASKSEVTIGPEQILHEGRRSLCWPMARAFLSICFVFACVFGVGLELVWSKATGMFIYIYSLLWFLSAICTLYILPIIAIGLILCAALHRHRIGMEGRTTLIIGICMAGVALDIALFFACPGFM